MKCKASIRVAAMLLADLAVPAALMSQERNLPPGKQHQYQFIDVGTLGGPNGYMPLLSLNQSGTFAGSADTTTPDP